MEIFIIIILVVVLFAIWVISTKRKLAVMDENVDNAMNQIGVQLSSRFDALEVLVDLSMGYMAQESKTLAETIKSGRKVIIAKSLPDEVLKQEELISETLGHITLMAEHCSEFKEDKNYAKCLDAVGSYEKMMQTSRLIYNDSVAKLNKTIQMIPTILIAGILGFHQRGYFVSKRNSLYEDYTTQHMS